MVLDDQTKLVYSPHVYGPSVYMQSYFKVRNFPRNMASVWQEHFAFAQQVTGAPIVIGEMGGSYEGLDREWQEWAVSGSACQPRPARFKAQVARR